MRTLQVIYLEGKQRLQRQGMKALPLMLYACLSMCFI